MMGTTTEWEGITAPELFPQGNIPRRLLGFPCFSIQGITCFRSAFNPERLKAK